MHQIKIYRKTDLPIKPAVGGAMMWAVGLDKAMLTYFEMEPDTQFPDHSHEAEQITLVLEGELTFAYEGETVHVEARRGDRDPVECEALRTERQYTLQGC